MQSKVIVVSSRDAYLVREEANAGLMIADRTGFGERRSA